MNGKEAKLVKSPKFKMLDFGQAQKGRARKSRRGFDGAYFNKRMREIRKTLPKKGF